MAESSSREARHLLDEAAEEAAQARIARLQRKMKEIVALAKAAGLATMIATMRPDIDNLDEYVYVGIKCLIPVSTSLVAHPV